MSIQSFSFILILFFLQLKRLPSASGFLASCFPCQRDALLHASRRPWPGAAHSLRAMVGSAEKEWGPVDKRCDQGDGTGGRPPPTRPRLPSPLPRRLLAQPDVRSLVHIVFIWEFPIAFLLLDDGNMCLHPSSSAP